MCNCAPGALRICASSPDSVPDPVEDLTDKEKEALRLLLAGHDAKSSARELGISHHTVNDRLRAARRKLDVTTSREAARILSEAEGTTPEPLVHNALGSAEKGEVGHPSFRADESPDHVRPGWRRKGWIVMSLALAAALGAALMWNFASNSGETATDEAQVQTRAAETDLETRIRQARSLGEAQAFLALLDEGDAATSYEAAGEAIRSETSFPLWELAVALRNNRANFDTRRIVGAGGREGGAESGVTDREIFLFRSQSNDRVLTESIMTEKVGSRWKVIDYELTGLDDEDE